MNSARQLRTVGKIGGGLGLAFLFLNLLSFGYGRDQGIYAAVGDAMLHGEAPYKGAWDFKPPAIYFIYAASEWILGRSESAIRIVEMLSWATVPFAFSRFTRSRSGACDREENGFIGFVGGVFAVYLQVFKDFWHTAQPEGFGAVCLVWALVLVREGGEVHARRRQAARWFAASLLSAFAGMLKPPLYGPLPLLFALETYERLRSPVPFSRRAALTNAGAVVLGTALPVAATLGYFVAKGALPDLVATLFGFVPLYTKLDVSLERLPSFISAAFTDITTRWTFALVVWPLAFTPWVKPKLRRAVDSWGLLAMILPTLAGVALQGKFFPYHYSATAPFVALAATAAIAALISRLSDRGVPSLLLAAASIGCIGASLRAPPDIYSIAHFWERVPWRVQAALHPEKREAIFDAISSEADVSASDNRALSSWIRENTKGAERLFIWGFEPVIYLTSERPRATRYLYNVPQRLKASGEAACQTLAADLAQTPPSTIVLEREDRFPWVTGGNEDSAESVSVCPEFQTRLSAFTLVHRSRKFLIFRPKPTGGERPAL